MQQSNTPKVKGIAARMGRWSAAHRKTAIGGWLLFLVLAVFIGQNVAPNELKGADQVRRRVRQGGEDAREGVSAAGRRDDPGSQRQGQRERRILPGGRCRRQQPRVEGQGRKERPGPLRSRRRPALQGSPLSPRHAGHQGRRGQGSRQDRPGRGPGKGRAAGEPRLPHRVVRHQRRQGAGGRLHEGPARRPGCCPCRSPC